jgi:YD repeat-containing protein
MNVGETGEKVTDSKGNITLKVTDRLGRIKKVTAEGKTTTYEYFDNGNKRSVQYQDGSREEFTYYKDNRLNTLINKTANGSVLESYSYTYDGAHNQTSKVDKKGTTIYNYDSLNRLETVTEPSGNVTRYEFDMAGNRTKETFTKALIINNVLRTITSYSYNEQNRLMRYSKVNEVKAKEVIVIDPCERLSQELIYGCKYMLEHVSCISCETVQRTCKYECESCLSYQMPEVMSFARSTKEAS